MYQVSYMATRRQGSNVEHLASPRDWVVSGDSGCKVQTCSSPSSSDSTGESSERKSSSSHWSGEANACIAECHTKVWTAFQECPLTKRTSTLSKWHPLPSVAFSKCSSQIEPRLQLVRVLSIRKSDDLGSTLRHIFHPANSKKTPVRKDFHV